MDCVRENQGDCQHDSWNRFDGPDGIIEIGWESFEEESFQINR